jgi:phosphatidylglycerol lysyltransferase
MLTQKQRHNKGWQSGEGISSNPNEPWLCFFKQVCYHKRHASVNLKSGAARLKVLEASNMTASNTLQARQLVLQYGWNSMAYQILNPGMQLWFAPEGDGVIGYVNAGSYRVVAGAPICPNSRLAAISAAFEAETAQAQQQVCYFGAQERLFKVIQRQHPSARLLLGAQPIWNPNTWPEILAQKSSLRAQIARARNKGVRIERWSAQEAQRHPELYSCLQEWLNSRGLPPMGFLVEPDTLNQLEDRWVFVALQHERVIAYLIASPIPLRDGWLVEQIIRGNGAPNGSSEMLLDAAMQAANEQGSDYLTLGLSPLSQHAPTREPQQAFWIKTIFSLVRLHANRFYNFAGLDSFKAKFQPQAWEPIYAISNERATSFGTLYAIAWAFGGCSPIRFVGHAVGRAALQELQWAYKRHLEPLIHAGE